MRELTAQEHMTALFVIALYHWYTDDKLSASYVMEVAVRIAQNPLAVGIA